MIILLSCSCRRSGGEEEGNLGEKKSTEASTSKNLQKDRRNGKGERAQYLVA